MTDIQLISIVLILMSILIINIGIFLYLKIILKTLTRYTLDSVLELNKGGNYEQ